MKTLNCTDWRARGCYISLVKPFSLAELSQFCLGSYGGDAIMASLVDARGRRLELRTDGTTRIGWASDNDLVLKDSTVSRHHAEICFDSGCAFLRDLGSSSGTFFGGVGWVTQRRCSW
jgi:hypothetical protein